MPVLYNIFTLLCTKTWDYINIKYADNQCIFTRKINEKYSLESAHLPGTLRVIKLK